jgi:hypothetical protein
MKKKKAADKEYYSIINVQVYVRSYEIQSCPILYVWCIMYMHSLHTYSRAGNNNWLSYTNHTNNFSLMLIGIHLCLVGCKISDTNIMEQ